MTVSIPRLDLNDGSMLPAIGFGTFPHDGDDSVVNTVRALEIGYRLLDTALSYGNESEVGEGIRRSDVPRADVIVTTKVPGRHHGYEGARESFAASSKALGLEAVDLLLIHWPLPRLGEYVNTWRALVELQQEGKVRSIGVSNFTPDHIRRLQDATGVTPAVNQIEMHPYFGQADQRRFHEENGIVTESWSPLGRGGDLLREPVLQEIAAQTGVSIGRVVLRWHVQKGVVPIPKSKSPDRQKENFDIFSFHLSDEQMARIDGLERGRIWAQDPDEYEEF